MCSAIGGGGAGAGRGGSAARGRGAGSGSSSNTTSCEPSILRNAGAAGACIASVSSSTSASGSGAAAGAGSGASSRPASIASISSCFMAAGGGAAGLGGGGGALAAIGGGSGALAAGLTSGSLDLGSLGLGFGRRLHAIVVGDDPPDGGKNLLHRGFLRLRRLNSCAFLSHSGFGPAVTANQPPRHAICEDSREYGTRKVERKQSPVDRSE